MSYDEDFFAPDLTDVSLVEEVASYGTFGRAASALLDEIEAYCAGYFG